MWPKDEKARPDNIVMSAEQTNVKHWAGLHAGPWAPAEAFSHCHAEGWGLSGAAVLSV